MSLLDGTEGCDPGFCAIWFRFRIMRRYLAYHSEQLRRIYRIMAISSGGPGQGPAHLLLDGVAEIGFLSDSDVPVWSHLGLPAMRDQCSILGVLLWMLVETRFPESCVRGKASGVVTLLTTEALCSSLTPHMSGRDKALAQNRSEWTKILLGFIHQVRLRLRGRPEVNCRSDSDSGVLVELKKIQVGLHSVSAQQAC